MADCLEVIDDDDDNSNVRSVQDEWGFGNNDDENEEAPSTGTAIVSRVAWMYQLRAGLGPTSVFNFQLI